MTPEIACCWHGNGGGENADPDCCVCCGNPCPRQTVVSVLDHERRRQSQERASWRREMAFAITHGHEPLDPFGSDPCPAECRVAGGAT